MAKARPVLVTAVLSAAAVVGYLSYRVLLGSDAAPDEAARAAAAAGAHAGLVERVPAITLEDLAGAPVAVSSWPGKPLIVNFWATWCGPCKKEIPLLKDLQSKRADLQVVGISIFDDRALAVEFAREIEFNYPALWGQREAVDAATAFGTVIQGLPYTIFAAADGTVLGAHAGEIHAEHLENFTAVIDDLKAGRIALPEARARIAGRM